MALNYSSFPNALDTFQEHEDISYLDKANLLEYQNLVMTANKTSTEIQRMNQLATILAGKLFKAYDFNKLQDAMYNVQEFFFGQLSGWNSLMQNIQNQTTQQQNDWNSIVNQQSLAWNEWFTMINVDIQTYATFNFENLAALNGIEKLTTFPTGKMLEVITTSIGGAKVAERELDFTTFATIERVYNSSGVIIRQTTTTKTFPNGNIKDVVTL